ncbi:O-succinylhomoserine sulfhydrylase [Caballeronia ptereochthonis]|uniref:O-succinylhomoserine sulfhydrylase n=1 Tax=Caballeronia ptereochthonis TaxID=1777144 RepID=A0A158E7C9_9BURK|nr:O-succinylhomoserine sulfhydrylase [Caballeronia ptereochthonis]SAL02704.1 O-succinylhomoserine sulfhydrylase [Caballeronia ptereochthonis]
MDDNLNFNTLAVRAGTLRSEFNEHAEALFLTSSFCFSTAAEAAERFRNAEEAYTYSRFTNPTVTMFQNRLAALEGGEACMATASGMSAILSVVMASMQQGDHIVSSKSLFGSTIGMFTQIFPKFGITTTFVDPAKPEEWQAALKPETKMFFLETPSNPLTEIADIEAIGKIAKAAGALFVVDNCFCSPALQQPLKLGADVVMHSATKFLDGQGRVLGGALVGSKRFIMETVFPFVRSAGPTMSAFNAWVLLKGMETLALRVEKQSANALEIARWLEAHPAVNRVFYPGLESHPQYEIAKKQQKAGGAIVSFELKGDAQEQQRANAWRVIDGTKLCSITGNLGDTRTTITHPSTTTHGRLTTEVREAAGIREGLIRLAVGLEDPADIRADLERGLR